MYIYINIHRLQLLSQRSRVFYRDVMLSTRMEKLLLVDWNIRSDAKWEFVVQNLGFSSFSRLLGRRECKSNCTFFPLHSLSFFPMFSTCHVFTSVSLVFLCLCSIVPVFSFLYHVKHKLGVVWRHHTRYAA